MTTSSVATLVFLPVNGVAVAVTRHSSGVSFTMLRLSNGKPGTPVRSSGSALLARDRRLDQPGEERVRPGRPGLQLGVRLGRDEVRVHVTRVLDVLDELVVGRDAGEDDPGALLQLRAIRVVDLVAVPVPLLDVRLVAVDLADDGAL